jgi:hypothetical protein
MFSEAWQCLSWATFGKEVWSLKPSLDKISVIDQDFRWWLVAWGNTRYVSSTWKNDASSVVSIAPRIMSDRLCISRVL